MLSEVIFPVLSKPKSAKSKLPEQINVSNGNDGSKTSSVNYVRSDRESVFHGNDNEGVSFVINRRTGGNREPGPAQDPADALLGLDDPNDFPDGGLKAWSVVLGSFFGLIVDLGLINSVGTIEAYVATHQLANVSISQRSWIFSVFAFFAYFGGIFTGPLFDKFGSKALIVVGTAMMCTGLLLMGQCTEVYQFILSFGVLVGLGDALLMTPLFGVISHWFVKRRGRAIGLASIGGSLGGVVCPLLLRALYPKVGFKWSMRALTLMYFSFLLISFFLVEDRLTHKPLDSQDYTQSLELNSLNEEESNESENQDKTFKTVIINLKNNFSNLVDFRILMNPKYLAFVFALFLSEFSVLFTMTYFSSYAISQGQTESTAFLLLTVLNSCGIFGRVIPGYFSDKFGTFNVMIVCTLVMTISMFVIWYPFGNNLAALYAFVSIYGFSSASVLTLSPVCCSKLVEAKNFGKAYGTAYFCVSFINLIGLVLGALVIGKGDNKGYSHMVLLTALLAATGTFFWCVARYFVGRGLQIKRC